MSAPDVTAHGGIRVGLISDTHGLWRPEAKKFLEGSQHIVHAGDIGKAAVLHELRALAPLCIVRGNNDTEIWAEGIPETRTLEIGGVLIHVLHDRAQLSRHPAPPGACVVIAGHSHQPCIDRGDERLFVNPGSAGPRRFRLPVAAGEIRIEDHVLHVRIVDLMTLCPLPGLAATLEIRGRD